MIDLLNKESYTILYKATQHGNRWIKIVNKSNVEVKVSGFKIVMILIIISYKR